jgi:hypothetical protein
MVRFLKSWLEAEGYWVLRFVVPLCVAAFFWSPLNRALNESVADLKIENAKLASLSDRAVRSGAEADSIRALSQKLNQYIVLIAQKNKEVPPVEASVYRKAASHLGLEVLDFRSDAQHQVTDLRLIGTWEQLISYIRFAEDSWPWIDITEFRPDYTRGRVQASLRLVSFNGRQP